MPLLRSGYTEGETICRLYDLLRSADVQEVISAIRLPDVRTAFPAYLRKLHGERPRYDLVQISSTPIPPFPPEVAAKVHAWLRMNIEGPP